MSVYEGFKLLLKSSSILYLLSGMFFGYDLHDKELIVMLKELFEYKLLHSSEMRNTTEKMIRAYCVTDKLPADVKKLEDLGLRILQINDFYVFIKYISDSEFSEVNNNRNLTDNNCIDPGLVEHINLISIIMQQTTVIPFRLNTIYNSEKSLKKFLDDSKSSLLENILNIDKKEEWTIRVFCDRRTLSEQIDELSKVSADLEKLIMASSPGKAYLLQRKKTELVKTEVDRICTEYSKYYFENFKNLSELSSMNNRLPCNIHNNSQNIILNATFLVSKERAPFFKKSAEILRRKDESTGFVIETSGPWPPFSFVTVKDIPDLKIIRNQKVSAKLF